MSPSMSWFNDSNPPQSHANSHGCKSAGDYTNVNKRQKEEATKLQQIHRAPQTKNAGLSYSYADTLMVAI